MTANNTMAQQQNKKNPQYINLYVRGETNCCILSSETSLQQEPVVSVVLN